MWNWFLLCFLVAAIGVAWFLDESFRRRKKIENLASGALDVWARLGPFESGHASSLALFCAWVAVGAIKSYATLNLLREHASSFESNRDLWERNRQLRLSNGVSHDDVEKAKALFTNPEAIYRARQGWDKV